MLLDSNIVIYAAQASGGAFVELNVCAYRDCIPRQFGVV